MRSVLIGTSTCKGEPVYYYLVAELQRNETECYGIRIKYQGASEKVMNITASAAQALALLESLRKGSVTPVTLRDIVEDWMIQEG